MGWHRNSKILLRPYKVLPASSEGGLVSFSSVGLPWLSSLEVEFSKWPRCKSVWELSSLKFWFPTVKADVPLAVELALPAWTRIGIRTEAHLTFSSIESRPILNCLLFSMGDSTDQ